MLKGAPAKLSATIALANDSQNIWEKVRGSWEVGRQIGDRKPLTWDRKVKREEVERSR